MTSTYFALLAEFGTANIPLERLAGPYFGLSPDKAAQRAARYQLPVPAFRAGSQKSPWLVSAAVLAEYLDRQIDNAARTHRAVNG